jgi:monoamine oxidase
MSVWSWIEKRVPGGHGSKFGQLLDVAYTTEFGADTVEQSALDLLYTLSGSDRSFQVYGASDERYHIQGGNQKLPEAMAAHLVAAGVRVQTGTRLAALRETPDGRYRLSLEKGVSSTEVVADFVVLALPFAVLRTLDCSGAGFDGLKQKAIHNLGRGRSAKLQLQFTKRLWNEHGPWGCSTGTTFTSCGYQNTWEPTRSQRGDGGILNNFTGGTHVEQLTTKKVFLQMPSSTLHEDAKSFLQAANSVFPGLPRLWNSKATISIPHLWPLFNCSYSYWRVGQYQSIAGYERIRQKNVLFAGEHTSVEFQGYMEGAAKEGLRAAQKILEQLGR